VDIFHYKTYSKGFRTEGPPARTELVLPGVQVGQDNITVTFFLSICYNKYEKIKKKCINYFAACLRNKQAYQYVLITCVYAYKHVSFCSYAPMAHVKSSVEVTTKTDKRVI
jgi:hypothetical protein